MTPYYQDDAVTIYHGDCRKFTIEADAVVTDPPYGTGHYETDTTVMSPALFRTWPRPMAMFGWPENLVAFCVALGESPDEWVTWWPTNAAAKSAALSGAILPHEAECVAIFGKGKWERCRRARTGSFQFDARRATANCIGGFSDRSMMTTDAKMGDVWTDASPGVAFQSHLRLHPNEKPVGVMSRLVDALTEPGGIVFDPFMGSGTTLRAAKDLGRKAIGIEIDERYCEIAAKRMAQEVLAL